MISKGSGKTRNVLACQISKVSLVKWPHFVGGPAGEIVRFSINRRGRVRKRGRGEGRAKPEPEQGRELMLEMRPGSGGSRAVFRFLQTPCLELRTDSAPTPLAGPR